MKKYFTQNINFNKQNSNFEYQKMINQIFKKKFFFEQFLGLRATRLSNFCIENPRQRRSITNIFHLSRMFVKKLFCLGKINGLKKFHDNNNICWINFVYILIQLQWLVYCLLIFLIELFI